MRRAELTLETVIILILALILIVASLFLIARDAGKAGSVLDFLRGLR